MSRELGSPDGPRLNPYERAVDRFNQQVSTGTPDVSQLQKALDAIKRTGTRRINPQELYANLAALSNVAANLAGQQGQDRARELFLDQQKTYQQTGELLSPGGASDLILPSQPNRTTGRSSG